MQKYLFVLLVGLAAACSPSKHGIAVGTGSSSKPSTGTQDGNSFETAIVIQETHETPGVRAEYK